jgi:uncharacterized protein involved in response to NO
MIKIEEKAELKDFALFNLGFRPFFFFAGFFAVITMLLWTSIYHGYLSLPLQSISPSQWHAHEMIFGYTVAVIAGFLLTSVKNWTSIQTPLGSKLGFMVAMWVGARLAFFFGEGLLITGAALNSLFMAVLLYVIASRIFKVQQWRQLPIIVVLTLFSVGEWLFLIGLVQGNYWLTYQSLYLGFYLVIMLIMVMGRRVIPFFIERGVGYAITLRQSSFLDAVVIAALGVFILNALVLHLPWGLPICATAIVIAQVWRLIHWHTPGIWKKPLLWSLYLSMVGMTLGFVLAAIIPFIAINPMVMIHAWAVGGIGMVTLSMMARVSLGHTGREIYLHSPWVTYSLLALLMAFIFRVIFPALLPLYYSFWVGVAQFFWIAAFAIFAFLYAPILFRPRVDGRMG